MEKEKEMNRIFKFHVDIPDRIISRESSWIEFKQSFNWNSKDNYAKTMASFSNNKGGYIVFGVKNKPRDIIGLKNYNFENLDESKISEYLNSVFSPEIIFEKFVCNVKKKKIGLIHTIQSSNKPVICIKNDGALKEAEIYYRYNARSEKIKYPELKQLLEQLIEKERKNWMEHFEKISKIGSSNAAVLDILDGKIEGPGGTLVIDKKLIPKIKFIKEGVFKQKGFPTLKLIGDVKPVSIVEQKKSEKFQITEDPTAPMVRIEEDNILKEYSLDYYTLTETLRERYFDFKQNCKYHNIKRNLKKDIKYCKTRYLDPKNPGCTKKDFYNPKIIKEFDKHYNVKPKGK